MVKILVFGDSIAWGAFDNECGGWVERLKTYYLNNYRDKGVGVYNLAVSSNDTRDVLKYLEFDITKIKNIEPEDLILLFSIGSNDICYKNEKENVVVPEQEFIDNLHKIVSISRKYSKNIIFTGLMGVDEKLTMPWNENEYWENEGIERYDKIIENMCIEENLEFIPLMGLIKEDELQDGLHPTTQGHKKIFEKVNSYLSKRF